MTQSSSSIEVLEIVKLITMCGYGCEICKEILSQLEEPSWFCRISRNLQWDRRVVRRHLTNLIDCGKIRVKNFGTIKLYEKKRR